MIPEDHSSPPRAPSSSPRLLHRPWQPRESNKEQPLWPFSRGLLMAAPALPGVVLHPHPHMANQSPGGSSGCLLAGPLLPASPWPVPLHVGQIKPCRAAHIILLLKNMLWLPKAFRTK